MREAGASLWAAAGLVALESLALALLLATWLDDWGLLPGNDALDWRRIRSWSDEAFHLPIHELIVALGFLPAAVLAGVAAPLLILARRAGWLIAMLAQALLLVACLARYVGEGGQAPPFVYPLLAYGVVTVLYLNARHVRAEVYDRPARASAAVRDDDLGGDDQRDETDEGAGEGADGGADGGADAIREPEGEAGS